MPTKRILKEDRIRKIAGGFSFIPHRFLADGFLTSLTQPEMLLYFFLVLAGDRYGLSYYSYDAICSLLQLTLGEYLAARDGLIDRDLLAFDGRLFQVLNLPAQPVQRARRADEEDPATVALLIRESLEYADQRRSLP